MKREEQRMALVDDLRAAGFGESHWPDGEEIAKLIELGWTKVQQQPEGSFRITVDVPAALEMKDLYRVFDAVAEAAHAWEEAHPDRDWDIFVAGGMSDHSLEEAFDRRGEAMLKALEIAQRRRETARHPIDATAFTAIVHALEDL